MECTKVRSLTHEMFLIKLCRKLGLVSEAFYSEGVYLISTVSERLEGFMKQTNVSFIDL